MLTPKFLLSISLVAVLIYTLVIVFLKKKELWNWFHTFCATFITFSCALAVGVILFNHQLSTQERLRKNDMKLLLEAELSDIIGLMEKNDNLLELILPSQKHKVLVTYIQPIVINEAIKSGVFNAVDSENLLHLSRRIERYNSSVSFLKSSLIISKETILNSQDILKLGVEDVESSRKGVIEGSYFIIDKMGLNLSPSIKTNQSNKDVSIN